MKPNVLSFLIVILLTNLTIGLAQTSNITNADYEVTNDVVKIEEYSYKQMGHEDISNEKLIKTQTINFKNGLIETKVEEIIASNISHHTKYKHTIPHKKYRKDYYRLNNGVKDFPSSIEYKLIVFNNNKFYIPIKDFVITRNIQDKILEFSYDNYGILTARKLELSSDNSIIDTYDDYGSRKFVYNQKGAKIESGFIAIDENFYSYYPDGLLKIQKVIYKSVPGSATWIYYYYSKDKEGNWTQKLEIEKTSYDEKITFTSRKLSYKNGEITGGNNYDLDFIDSIYTQYQVDSVKTIIMGSGCVNGDCQYGKGIFIYKNGDRYEGTFRAGLKDGKGTYKTALGDTYTGEFLYGEMYGEGVFITRTGDKYAGSFKKNKFDGEIKYFNSEKNENYIQIYKEGTLISTTKETYIPKTGCVRGDCKNGIGKKMFNDGATYEGNFQNGWIQGKGKMTWKNGDYYEGEWVENFQHGQGVYFWINGDVYTGMFVNGNRTGLGTYTYKNGNKYVGNWLNSKRHGKNDYYDYVNGKKYEAIFKEGELIESLSTTDISKNGNEIPNGLVWTKNAANTEYFLYNNGVVLEGNTFWVENSLYVYLTNKQEIYLLKDFKIKSADSYYNAELLPYKFEHGAWYKSASEGTGIFNKSGKNISNEEEVFKYLNNNVDVIFKGTYEKETFLLKRFNKAIDNKVYPIELFTPVQTYSDNNSNTTTGFQTEINTCKQQSNPTTCISDKFFENYTSLKNSGATDETIIQTSVENLNSIGNYNFETLFEILMDSKRFYSEDVKKIVPKIDANLRAKVKEHAQKVVDDYSRTHRN